MLVTKTIEAVKRLEDGCIAMRLNKCGPDDHLIFFIAPAVEFTLRAGDTLTADVASDTGVRQPVRRFRYNAGPWMRGRPGEPCPAGNHCRSDIIDMLHTADSDNAA